MILPGSDPAALALAMERLRAGELVAIPTETVYGLAADALSNAAVARIFAAKGRPENHPLIVHVLDLAQAQLPATPAITQSLQQLRWLAGHIAPVQVSFDLADARGYAYYSGLRFAIYAQQASDALVRGGRYDGVGAVFGHHVERRRPAVGFSMDLKQLVAAVPALPLRAAIRAPWGDAADLLQAIARLRQQGETVVCVLPGHESEVDEFHCDRVLLQAAGQWVVQAL